MKLDRPTQNILRLIILMIALGTGLFVAGSPQTLLATAFVPGQSEAAPMEQASATVTQVVPADPEALAPVPASQIDEETLWLARCIISETNRPVEQELVAWVIRNRVENNYRGAYSYEQAVLDPYQFSAFNPGSSVRRKFTGLTATSDYPGFQRALAIAHYVRSAPADARPFEAKTHHFYSERSMVGGHAPAWARGEQPVSIDRTVEIQEERFRFYADLP
jgi:hypothetical protein